MSELMKAVQEFLQSTLRDRHYCPRCMGYLPKHEGDCKLGKLISVYEKVSK
jgi:hypothetical protein